VGNPISSEILTGTIGELLVQLRLLQYGIQAAPPIKDSGNDLIAVRGEVFRGIQVKTSTRGRFHNNNMPEYYHLLASVMLSGEDDQIYLDNSEIYLISREELEGGAFDRGDLAPYAISQGRVDQIFPPE